MTTAKRNRSVALTATGLDELRGKLSVRLDEHMRSQGKTKLTRELKAELLGVSARTADRIFAQEQVDRTTLITAFQSVNATWSESYIDRRSTQHHNGDFTDSGSQESGTHHQNGDCPGPVYQEKQDRRPSDSRPKAAMFVGLVLVGASVVLGAGGPSCKAITRENEAVSKDREYVRNMEAATLAYHKADYLLAQRLIEKAWPHAKERRASDMLAWAYKVEAEILSAQGNKKEALKKANRALIHFDLVAPQEHYDSTLEVAAKLKLELGQLSEARSDYLELLGRAQKSTNRYMISAACRGLGSIAFKERKYAEAIRWFDKGLDTLGPNFEVDMVVDLRARRAQAAAHQGEIEASISALEECLAYWTQKGHERWIATSRYRLASIMLLKGDRVTATSLLVLARNGYEGVGDFVGVGRCNQLLAN